MTYRAIPSITPDTEKQINHIAGLAAVYAKQRVKADLPPADGNVNGKYSDLQAWEYNVILGKRLNEQKAAVGLPHTPLDRAAPITPTKWK